MNTADRLKAITAEMINKGWDKGFDTASVKRATSGEVVAVRASNQFVQDVQDAAETVDAREAMAELMRRYG